MLDLTSATILADSIGPHGIRLTTLEVAYPHFIHKEVMTHRVFSRNYMSMRAVPPEKIIEQVLTQPVVPNFHGRVKGMGTSGILPGRRERRAKVIWLEAREDAIRQAQRLLALGVAKSDVNPLLEPFIWMRGIITATEWDNFFALRTESESARKEFVTLARKMQEAMLLSEPEPLLAGEWHLPGLEIGSELAEARTTRDYYYWASVSAGRLARISFDRHHAEETRERSQERTDALIGSGHWSPLEHQAEARERTDFIGNLRGYKQYRKYFPHEENYEARKLYIPTGSEAQYA